MFGSNPFGECPESVPVNFELICFDTDQLLRDMTMFLDYVLKLDIYDLRAQLKENVYGGHGYSIQKYYYLINYYKVPFHSLEYVVPSAVFPSFGKEQQSIYILNLSTAVMYLCFAQPFIPYDYNDLIEQESLGEVPISPLQYNDLFSLSDAIPSCFLLLRNEHETENEIDFDISPDHWIINTWIETITQLCLAKIHKNIHERIQQSLPNSGIVFFTKMMELVKEEFSVLKGFPKAQDRVTEIIKRLNSNLNAGSGNLMDVAIELSEDYPFKKFIGQLFTVLQKAYEEIKQKTGVHLAQDHTSEDVPLTPENSNKRKNNKEQHRKKKRSKSSIDAENDFSKQYMDSNPTQMPTETQNEPSNITLSEQNSETLPFKKVVNITSFISTVNPPDKSFPKEKPLSTHPSDIPASTSLNTNDTIHIWKNDKNTKTVSRINQIRQTDIANSVRDIFNSNLSSKKTGYASPTEEFNKNNAPHTRDKATVSGDTHEKIKNSEASQSGILRQTKNINNVPTTEPLTPDQEQHQLTNLNKSTLNSSSTLKPNGSPSNDSLANNPKPHALPLNDKPLNKNKPSQEEGSKDNQQNPDKTLLTITTDELKIPKYIDKLDIPLGVPADAWRSAIVKSYTQFLKSAIFEPDTNEMQHIHQKIFDRVLSSFQIKITDVFKLPNFDQVITRVSTIMTEVTSQYPSKRKTINISSSTSSKSVSIPKTMPQNPSASKTNTASSTENILPSQEDSTSEALKKKSSDGTKTIGTSENGTTSSKVTQEGQKIYVIDESDSDDADVEITGENKRLIQPTTNTPSQRNPLLDVSCEKYLFIENEVNATVQPENMKDLILKPSISVYCAYIIQKLGKLYGKPSITDKFYVMFINACCRELIKSMSPSQLSLYFETRKISYTFFQAQSLSHDNCFSIFFTYEHMHLVKVYRNPDLSVIAKAIEQCLHIHALAEVTEDFSQNRRLVKMYPFYERENTLNPFNSSEGGEPGSNSAALASNNNHIPRARNIPNSLYEVVQRVEEATRMPKINFNI